MPDPNTPAWQAQCLAEFDSQAANYPGGVHQNARTEFANWLANLAYALNWACVLHNIGIALAFPGGGSFTVNCEGETPPVEEG